MKLTNKEFYAKGRRGVVSTAQYNGTKVIIKETNPKAKANTIEHEAEILAIVNKKGIGPKCIAYHDNALICEFIEGEEIRTWMETATKQQLMNVLEKVLLECRTLDVLQISKKEMTRPFKHILIRNNKPVQIDFERAIKTKKPQNVTQFCQWLSNKRMQHIFETKTISIDAKELRELAKTYKERYDDTTYNKIVRLLR